MSRTVETLVFSSSMMYRLRLRGRSRWPSAQGCPATKLLGERCPRDLCITECRDWTACTSLNRRSAARRAYLHTCTLSSLEPADTTCAKPSLGMYGGPPAAGHLYHKMCDQMCVRDISTARPRTSQPPSTRATLCLGAQCASMAARHLNFIGLVIFNAPHRHTITTSGCRFGASRRVRSLGTLLDRTRQPKRLGLICWSLLT